MIKQLEKLESVFREAGQLACKMQATAKHYNKFNSGLAVTDIVTEADLAVQEFLLGEMAKTDLINCRLLAEEDTPAAKIFKNQNNFYLGLDPIDGTAVYARGGKQFSVIVTLHDGENLLYTYKHFPVLNWTQKIVGKKYITIGTEPEFKLDSDAKNKIFYYKGSPEKSFPEAYKKLTNAGFVFENCANSLADVDEAAMAACKKAAGYYCEDPNVYDGLVTLHYAQAQNLKCYVNGKDGKIDLSDVRKRSIGLYYPGSYLILN